MKSRENDLIPLMTALAEARDGARVGEDILKLGVCQCPQLASELAKALADAHKATRHGAFMEGD